MAAVLALPDGMPFKPRLIAIVFGVTFVTLVMQALPFARLLRWLGVVERATDPVVASARARLIVARRGQSEVDAMHDQGLISRRAHAEKKAVLQRQALDAERTLREAEIEGGDGQVEAAILEAQRGALVDAARRGVLEADIVEAQTAEIDRSLLGLREHEGQEK